MSGSRRIAQLLVLVCVLATTGGVLAWAAGSPIASYAGVRSGGQDFDGLVTGAAGLLAWLCLGWFGATLALEAAAALPGCWGRACDSLAEHVTPQVVRKVAQALIGVTVLAGPLAGGSAMAVERPQHAAASVSFDRPAAVREFLATDPTPSPSPSLSSTPPSTSSAPPSSAPPSSAPPSSAPSPSAPSPSDSPPLASFDLDRPVPAVPPSFVPAPPPAPVRQALSGPATLVAGTVHRDNTIDAYVVHRGDALWNIAARHLGPQATAADIAREWPRWYAANREVIGPDPGVIRPGELLRPPA